MSNTSHGWLVPSDSGWQPIADQQGVPHWPITEPRTASGIPASTSGFTAGVSLSTRGACRCFSQCPHFWEQISGGAHAPPLCPTYTSPMAPVNSQAIMLCGHFPYCTIWGTSHLMLHCIGVQSTSSPPLAICGCVKTMWLLCSVWACDHNPSTPVQ